MKAHVIIICYVFWIHKLSGIALDFCLGLEYCNFLKGNFWFLMNSLKQKVIKNNQELGICNGQARMIIVYKIIIIANPIGMLF